MQCNKILSYLNYIHCSFSSTDLRYNSIKMQTLNFGSTLRFEIFLSPEGNEIQFFARSNDWLERCRVTLAIHTIHTTHLTHRRPPINWTNESKGNLNPDE